jgi:hypothetical protein
MVRVSRGSPPSLGGLREDRDRLSRDNEDLREKLNTLQNELSDLGSNLVRLDHTEEGRLRVRKAQSKKGTTLSPA